MKESLMLKLRHTSCSHVHNTERVRQAFAWPRPKRRIKTKTHQQQRWGKARGSVQHRSRQPRHPLLTFKTPGRRGKPRRHRGSFPGQGRTAASFPSRRRARGRHPLRAPWEAGCGHREPQPRPAPPAPARAALPAAEEGPSTAARSPAPPPAPPRAQPARRPLPRPPGCPPTPPPPPPGPRSLPPVPATRGGARRVPAPLPPPWEPLSGAAASPAAGPPPSPPREESPPPDPSSSSCWKGKYEAEPPLRSAETAGDAAAGERARASSGTERRPSRSPAGGAACAAGALRSGSGGGPRPRRVPGGPRPRQPPAPQRRAVGCPRRR